MFDRTRLKEVLVQYKQSFVSQRWGDEKYKWEAVKWFQDNWDVNAPDFTGIPKIETIGERLYTELLDLIWKMDNGPDYISSEEAYW